MHTLSLGTALLDELAAAVQAVQDRLQNEPGREGTRARVESRRGVVHTLSLGAVLLDLPAVAVRAVQGRLRLEPGREETHAQGPNLGKS